MHDYDRTSLESDFGEYESDEFGYEGETGPYVQYAAVRSRNSKVLRKRANAYRLS